MKLKLTMVTLLALFAFGAKAQLSGVFSVPGTYTSVADAIIDLNTLGVNGAVTVNIAAGYNETAPVGGYTLTATGTAANPITFKKNGAGANPLITAYAGGVGTPGTAIQDGVWSLIGSDYITIDGIDINDPNAANPATMEFGYGLFKANAGDGCQFNTIKNCVITLNRINNAAGTTPATDGSRGIDVVNALNTAHNAVVTVTAATGSNSNNMFYSNTIQNCNIGIAIIGFAATSPFANADMFNDVGGMSAATGNTIINFGGGGTASAAAGIRTLAQYNINVSNNLINSNNGTGVNHAAVLRGIFLNTATSANASVMNNTITVNGGATTASIVAIENTSGSTAASNTINITNNLITNCTYPTTTSGAFFGIYNNSASPAYLNVNNNIVSNLTLNTVNSTGSVNCIYISGTMGSGLSISSNTVQNLVGLKTSGNYYGIYANNATNNYTVQGNYINNVSRGPGLAGTMYGYYNFGLVTGGTGVVTNNMFSNMSGGTGASIFYGIYNATDVVQLNAVSNNTIMNITNGTSDTYGINFGYGSAGSVINNNIISNISGGALMNGINISGGPPQGLTIRNNTINSFTTTGAFSVVGISHAGGIGSNVYKNKIYDLTVINAGGSVVGLRVPTATTSFTAHNNYIGDLKAPMTNNGVNTVVGIQVSVSSANSSIHVYYNTIYINASSSGINFGTTGFLHTTSTNSTTSQLFLRNNIIINTSTPNGTGIVAAYRRTTATLNNFNIASNNNNFYAGTPGPNNLLYYDGVNSFSTVAAYQTLVAPRDAASITESTPFLSTSGPAANYLHIDPNVPSLTESGAVNVGGITDDYDNDIRQGNPGYAGSGIAPDMGADEYNQILASCSVVTGGSITATSFSRCAGQTVSMNATGVTTGSGITYQWQVSSTPSGPYSNVVGGSGATTPSYTTAPLTMGTFYFVMLTTCTITSSSTITVNESTVTVNATPTASASSNSPLCSGQTLNFTGGTDIGTNFMWTGPNSYTSTSQNPTLPSSTPSLSGVYNLVVSAANCTATPVTTTVIVSATPSALTVSPTSASLCAGSSQTLAATGGVINNTMTFGTQANQNTTLDVSTDFPAPYTIYYGGQRMQILILASELTAAGFVANSPITSVQFPVVSKGSNWGTTTTDCKSFQVNIGTTALTSLAAFQSGLTNVVAPMSFTPFVGYNNNHTFSSPFIWNGTSNVILETSFSNNILGTTGDAVIQYNSPTAFNSTIVFRTDNMTAVTMATTTTVSYVYAARPDFKLNGMSPSVFLWSPAAGLSSTSTLTTVATPTTSTNYTLTASNGVCTSNVVTSLTVVPLPSVTVAATPTAVCPGGSSTLTATGAATYSWTPAIPMTGVITPTATSNYTVMGSDVCGTDTQTISVIVNPSPTVSAATSASILCTGNSATITATGATTYSWTSIGAGASIVVSPTTTTTYTVEGTDANGCMDTTTFVQTVSPCTGIENILANSNGVNVYPNPTTGLVTLVVSDLAKGMEVEIYDAVGKKVLTQRISNNQTVINISELANGIYSYRVNNANGYIKQGKLVKE